MSAPVIAGRRVAPALFPLALVVAVAALLAFAPGLVALTPTAGRSGGLIILTIGLWATGAVPEYLTALLFFLLAVLSGAAPPAQVFSGFASAAFWLVFGGLVIGVAVQRSGLGERLAALPVERLGRSYGSLIGIIVTASVALAFLLPSTMSRVVLVVPICAALADRLGYAPGGRGRSGMMLAAVLGTYFGPVGILPATVPVMVMAGAVETLYGLPPRYGPYLWLQFPMFGVLKSVLLAVMIARMFAERPAGPPVSGKLPPWPPEALRLTVVLVITLAFWTTDVVHHISPAWVALAAALLCLWPATRLMPPDSFNRLNFAPMFYIAGVLGVAALVGSSGLGTVLADRLLTVLPLAPGADAGNFASLVALACALGTVTTMPGLSAVLTPLAGRLAEATGWPIAAVVMTQVVAFSATWLPYQVPPLVVGLQMGGVRARDAARLMVPMAALTLILLAPLAYAWWRMAGLFEPAG